MGLSMADSTETDVLELDEELEAQAEGDEQDQDGDAEAEESDEDDLIIEGEEDSPPSGDRDTGLVRDLRARIKAQAEQLKRFEGSAPKIALGPKPTLEDHNFDADQFETALLKWHEDASKVEQAKDSQQGEVERFRTEVEEHRGTYQRQQADLKVPGFELAEARVLESLSEPQQTTLLLAAKNKAAVVAALGKYPKRLEALAGIQNPIMLAVAVAELERNLKVQPRRKAPEPEERMRGSAPLAQATDKKLERLEADAARSGDRTKLIAYKTELRAKGK